MTSRILLAAMFVFSVTIYALGQQKPVKYDLSALSESGKLQVSNRKVTAFSENSKKGISFSESAGDGIAWLEGVTFENGIIELDIKGKDVFQQSFLGVAFHGKDENTFDAIYFRPFNFQAADSVRRIHAVQYISHPDFTWNKLRAEQNGKYENPATPAPNPNDWFHVKIEVKHPQVKVYVNNHAQPSLSISQLSSRKTGKIGLWVGNNSGGSFTNLTITKQQTGNSKNLKSE